MTARTAPTDPALPEQSVLDTLVLDAALWRLQRRLARQWLHDLRGSLNAMSLNLVLLRTGAGRGDSDADERTWQGLRTQLRDLDAGLTRLLDQSALDQAVPHRADLGGVLASALAILEPLAKRKQVQLEAGLPDPAPLVTIGPVALHGIVLTLLAGLLEKVAPQTQVNLFIETEGDRLRLDLSAEPGLETASDDTTSPLLLAAVRRILQSDGGDLREHRTSNRETLSILLRDTSVTPS